MSRNLVLAGVLAGFFLMNASGAVKIEKIDYRGWHNSYRISNGTVELVVLTDVGPRIIKYGFVGKNNVFREFDAEAGKTGEISWVGRGGHRLWIAPEDKTETYALDNSPCTVNIKGTTFTVTGPVEKETGVQKQMVVRLADSGSMVEIRHHIINRGAKPRKLAPWALSQMAQGGTGFTAFPERRSHSDHLAPTNPLTMWGYTDFSDPRWKFTPKYLILKQDPKNNSSQKAGLIRNTTFGAYLLGSDLFVKRSRADESMIPNYPDFGCSFEMYTDANILELETLGPLVTLKPGASVEHTEHWMLQADVKIPTWTDAALDSLMAPLLK